MTRHCCKVLGQRGNEFMKKNDGVIMMMITNMISDDMKIWL